MVWSKDKQQMLQAVNKDANRKASVAVSVAQVCLAENAIKNSTVVETVSGVAVSVVHVCLAENAIKNGTVVETVSGVIDTAFFLAKESLDECICHLQSDRPIDRDWLVEMLLMSRDLVQLVSVYNALTEMTRFVMVDVAARAVHSGIQNLYLQTTSAVFGQTDIGQLERLCAEILVSPDSLWRSAH